MQDEQTRFAELRIFYFPKKQRLCNFHSFSQVFFFLYTVTRLGAHRKGERKRSPAALPHGDVHNSQPSRWAGVAPCICYDSQVCACDGADGGAGDDDEAAV